MQVKRTPPPIPRGGSIEPIHKRLSRKYVNDLVPTKTGGGSRQAARAALKASGGMFGGKDQKEGPMQKAASRNFQPLAMYDELELGLSKEEQDEVQPTLDAIAIGLRPKESVINNKYRGYAGRREILPPQLAKCLEEEKTLFWAEEEKVQKWLDNADDEFRKNIENLGKSMETFRKPVLDPYEVDDLRRVPPAVYQVLSASGLLGLTIPKKYGGKGFNQKQYGESLRGMVRKHSSALEGIISAHNTIGAAPLLKFGTEEQIKKYLPQILKGDFTCAFALTEPSSGTDADAMMTTVARLSPDGKHYKLKGAKIYTTNFHTSGLAYVMAKVDDGKGNYLPTAFIVELPFRITDTDEDRERKLKELGAKYITGGKLHAGAPQDLETIIGSNQCYYELDELEVSAKNVLGPVGGGMGVAYESLNEGRAAFADACAEGAKLATEEATNYVAQREIFKMYGGKLSDLPRIKSILAEMAVRTAVINAASEMTAALIDKHGKDTNIMAECAAIKVLASRESNIVIDLAHRIYGGTGFMKGMGHMRAVKDAKITKSVEGDDDAMTQFQMGAAAKVANGILRDVAKADRALVGGFWELAKTAFFKWDLGFKYKPIKGWIPWFKRESSFGLWDSISLQVRTKLLGAKAGYMAMRYGKDAMLQQHKLIDFGKQNIENYALVAAMLKHSKHGLTMKKSERVALEHFINNRSMPDYFPDEIADVLIKEQMSEIKNRIKEEKELIKDYKAKHAID